MRSGGGTRTISAMLLDGELGSRAGEISDDGGGRATEPMSEIAASWRRWGGWTGSSGKCSRGVLERDVLEGEVLAGKELEGECWSPFGPLTNGERAAATEGQVMRVLENPTLDGLRYMSSHYTLCIGSKARSSRDPTVLPSLRLMALPTEMS